MIIILGAGSAQGFSQVVSLNVNTHAIRSISLLSWLTTYLSSVKTQNRLPTARVA